MAGRRDAREKTLINAKAGHREQEDGLEEAIDRVNMERVGITIIRKTAMNRPIMDKSSCLAVISKALSDKTRLKSSRNGTIEAINGK